MHGYSRSAAPRFLKRVREAITRLAQFPMSGRLTDEWGHLGVRQVMVADVRLLYHIVGDTGEILAVHPARIPLPPEDEATGEKD